MSLKTSRTRRVKCIIISFLLFILTFFFIIINHLNIENKNVSIIKSKTDNKPLHSLLFPHYKLIRGNPMSLIQCWNAIIDKENIDILSELKEHLPKIYPGQNISQIIDFLLHRQLPQFWGREQLNSIKNDVVWWSGARIQASFDPFWFKRVKSEKLIRTQRKAINQSSKRLEKERRPFVEELTHFNSLNEGHFNKFVVAYDDNAIIDSESYDIHKNLSQIVYFHIPKCGTSSIRSMLNAIGGTRVVWTQSLLIGYPKPSMLEKEVKCAFTFIRNPIHRFISAYYTIDALIKSDIRRNRKKMNYFYGEHLKFFRVSDHLILHKLTVFFDELVNDSWLWMNRYLNQLSIRVMEHIGSQTGHCLSAYEPFWNISYFGRIEYFAQHWKELSTNVQECSSGYLENVNVDSFEHRMKKYGQSMHHTLNRILPDAYYLIAARPALFDQIVNYYYQDFVCFGYNMTYAHFMQYIKQRDPQFDIRSINQTLLQNGL